MIRAASFHHIDRHLGLSIGGLALNGWLELLALAAIGLPALLQRRFWRLDTTSAAHRAGTIR